jgi:DNA polymerase V
MDEEFYGSGFRGSKQPDPPQAKKTRSAGFGVPSGDHMQKDIDLNELLVGNRSATFFFRMKGDAMTGAGIFDNDMLIVDRSLKLVNGNVVVAILNGELLVRRFHKNFSSAFLIPENSRLKPVNLAEFSDFSLWGVVTYVIHPL